MSPLRVTLALVGAATLAACSAIVGIGDVPGAPSNTTQDGATGDDVGDDAPGDGTMPLPMDGGSDAHEAGASDSAHDGPVEATPQDAGKETSAPCSLASTAECATGEACCWMGGQAVCGCLAGAGTQGAACSASVPCAPGYACVVPNGQSTGTCLAWCAFPSGSCAPGTLCEEQIQPAPMVGGTTYGECTEFDSGCGPLNTTTNCSACGDTCAAVSTSVISGACNGPTFGTGATCSYACASGYLDCNGTTKPPNRDGCECNVPGATQAQCCATAGGDCPVQHRNGLSQATSLFYDCVPAGTMSSQLAQDACIAYVGAANAADCQQYEEVDASVPDSWCSGPASGDCVCWTFSGLFAGQVLDAKAAGLTPTNCYYGQGTTSFN